jgi:hypothetical protein
VKYKFENKNLIMKNIFFQIFFRYNIDLILKIEIINFKTNKLKLIKFRIRFFLIKKKNIFILYFSILIFFQNNIWYLLKINMEMKKKIFENRRECQMNRKKWNVEFNLILFSSKRCIFFILFDISWIYGIYLIIFDIIFF